MRPELIEATRLIQKGDDHSIEDALERLQSTVYAFSMKVCGHPQDAEDNMQEVLYRSLPHLKKISDPNALAVWLYTVTKNRCWRSRRRSAHAPQTVLSLDELMPERSEMEGLLGRTVQSQPEDALLQQERNDELQAAILELPTRYRLVLVLHDVEGLATDQVSAILRIQPGTVRVRLHRARLFVRKALVGPRRTASTDQRPKAQRCPVECKKLFENLSEYLDDRLPVGTCDQMRVHIEACPACVAFIDDLRRAIDRCRELQGSCDPQTPANLRSLLTQEYRRLINSSGIEKNS